MRTKKINSFQFRLIEMFKANTFTKYLITFAGAILIQPFSHLIK
jgi:hypothetical protein